MLREGGFLKVEDTINNMTSNIRKTKPHAPITLVMKSNQWQTLIYQEILKI